MEPEVIVPHPKRFSLFSHQTSGHSCMIKVTNTSEYILKPRDQGEQKFYQMIQKIHPTKFLQFIPKFFGVYDPLPDELMLFEELARKLLEEQECNSAKLKKKNKGHTDFLQKLYSERFNPKTYIKLEDLTNEIKFPRILDLKLGFTAYNEKKIHSQSKKYSKSTCGTEGFRFCGFKGFLEKTEEIIFRDKYWGFQLKREDLLHAFGIFFFDGEKILKTVIYKFILKLDDLIESLNEMKGYVFHSSSLLLIYGDISEGKSLEKSEILLKLVDFANVQISEDKISQCDEDLVRALKNIKSYLKELYEIDSFDIDLNF